MLWENLKVKELYASIYATSIIEEMFKTGLKIGSTLLAVSAMEELIIRGDTDIIRRGLDSAFKEGHVKIGTSMSTLIALSLSESCREADPFLQHFGEFLFKAKTNDPFTEFVNGPGLEFRSSGDLLEFFLPEGPTDLETAISVGFIAQELKRARETKERLQKLADDSFLEWMKKVFSDSGADQSVIDKLFSEMTPGQIAALKKDVMDCSN